MPFSDDYPLNPPPLQEDWAQPVDRNAYDSLTEVRVALQEITALLSGLERETVPMADGRLLDILARNAGRQGTYGFAVEDAGGDEVTVSPSVVSGMGAWATVPRIGGVPLTDSPAPRLGVSGKSWVAIYMEVNPDFEILYEIPGDPPQRVYGVAEGSGSLIGEVEIRAYDDEADMESSATPAAVDATTGGVTESGKYVIPLAHRGGDGIWQPVGYRGPLGVRMCRSGAFIALGPARGPGEEIPT